MREAVIDHLNCYNRIENGGSVFFLRHHSPTRASEMDECLKKLEAEGQRTFYDGVGRVVFSFMCSVEGTRWCNATWDTVLCWPATRADSSATQQCPVVGGYDPASALFFRDPSENTCVTVARKNCVVRRGCSHVRVYFSFAGTVSKWCHESGHWLANNESDYSKPYGDTDYNQCIHDEVIDILNSSSPHVHAPGLTPCCRLPAEQ